MVMAKLELRLKAAPMPMEKAHFTKSDNHICVVLQRASRYRAFSEQRSSGPLGVRTAFQHPHNLHELLNIISSNPWNKLYKMLLCLVAPKAQHDLFLGQVQLLHALQPVLTIPGFPRDTTPCQLPRKSHKCFQLFKWLVS